MLIFKKEKAVRELIAKHLSETRDCVAESRAVLEDYLAGDEDSMHDHAHRMKTHERQADELKRQIRDALHDGAFLPQIRSDVHRLVEGLDGVAGAAERVAQFIVGQSPSIPEPFGAGLLEVYGLCVTCFHELRKAMKDFFKPKGEIASLHDHATRVGDLESEIDVLEAALTRRMFDSDEELAEKIHFSQLLRYITAISDLSEDLADELESTVMRSVV